MGGGLPFGRDPATLQRLFGTTDVLALWVAEPSVPLAPTVVAALRERAATGWYGYEARPDAALDAFWAWMHRRHGWDGRGLQAVVSPSIATSIGVLVAACTPPDGGVVIQPPVFTDFRALVRSGGRRLVRNPLLLDADGGYRMDTDQLATAVEPDDVGVLVLCNPHNPVGRAWHHAELRAVAEACAAHGVVVVADEVHADVVLPGHAFVSFAVAAEGTGVRWAALHGPIKTFGLAGVCDTLLVTDDDDLRAAFQRRSDQFHLTRNNVFSLAALEVAYRDGDAWLDAFLDDVAANRDLLAAALPREVRVAPLKATFLAWLDLRALDLDVPELATWLAEEAGLALSPGHWFGREGAGFARMTLAVERDVAEGAAERLAGAVAARRSRARRAEP